MYEAKEIVLKAAEAADDRRAREIVLLDMGEVSLVADYFLICSGTSLTHVKAIADFIVDKLDEEGIMLLRREGHRGGEWILLDYAGVVVHVFRQETRMYYDLERLWGDAPQMPYPFNEAILAQKEE